MNVFELSAAYIADWVFGDPTNYPHPVKLIGKAIQFLENKLLYKGYSPSIQRLLGGILLISITFISGSSTWAIIRLVEWIHPTLSSI
jgi:adenosylcobinamide-phosphate synthase